jgi:outer membrane protein W
MHKQLWLVPLAVLAVLAAPGARAADPEFARSGPYIGVGGTYAFNLVESSFDDFFDDVDVDDTWGGNARIGYRAFSWLAAEVEYEYLDNFEVSADGVHLADLRAQTISANVRFIAPIERFQPYLCLGAGATLFSLDDNDVPGLDVDHSSFSGRIGVGFDVYATAHVVLGVGADVVLTAAEVEDPYFSGDTSSSLSYVAVHVGVDYRF